MVDLSYVEKSEKRSKTPSFKRNGRDKNNKKVASY